MKCKVKCFGAVIFQRSERSIMSKTTVVSVEVYMSSSFGFLSSYRTGRAVPEASGTSKMSCSHFGTREEWGGKWRCAKCINDCKQATFAYKCAFRTFLEKYLAGGAFLHKLLLKSIGTIWNGPNFRWLFSGRARLGALPAIAVLGATCATLLIPQ